ncbi:MAG: competence/damage-inducible protein A [Alphaproteobacteria bacterium]|nr:competence/damage-inducible protein A [Alphaproteobacteria bacterium]
MRTAAVIIIGNEILSGKFADENGPYLIGRLRALGVRLRRLVVVEDTLDELSEEIRGCAERHDLVFTTGGVGPTHDDITMDAVAAAFGVPVVERADLIEMFERYAGGPINAATRRMASIPDGSELWWEGALRFPVVVKENVHIFPGVPSFMRLKFEAIAARFADTPVHTARVTTRERESDIAARLSQAVARWPAVEIGSYPRFEAETWHVIVTLEGPDPGAVEACRAWLAGSLEPVQLSRGDLS